MILLDNLRLENNEIVSNNEGVQLDLFNKKSFNVSILRNVISLNDACGIRIEGSLSETSFVGIKQNYITSNKQNGILLNLKSTVGVAAFFIGRQRLWK